MSTDLISGVVTDTKASGIKIGEEWVSFTRFGPGANVEHPEKGASVTVQVDEKRFIQSLVRNGHQEEPVRRNVYSEAEDHGGDRNLSIVRQVCLKAAVELYPMITDRAEVKEAKPTDVVLGMAARFEKWVTRPLVET